MTDYLFCSNILENEGVLGLRFLFFPQVWFIQEVADMLFESMDGDLGYDRLILRLFREA